MDYIKKELYMIKTEITVATRDFGEINVSSDSIISFPNGIFAFEELKSFVLISPLGDGVYPMWLQCTEKSQPCFIVYDPFEITNDYSPKLGAESKKVIEFDNYDDLHYLVIAVVPEDFKKTTVNLKSPIIINKNKSIAAQVILDEDYKIKFPIFDGKGEK